MGGGYHDSTREWTDEEVLFMLDMLSREGRSWKRIANRLHRSTNSVRNKFQRMSRSVDGSRPAVNRCSRCGELRRGHFCSTGPVMHRAPTPDPVLCNAATWRTDMILDAVAAYASESGSLVSAP